ncbi:sulfite exporter TauE/SafE family protein [Bradyrhizobium sp. USDA 10063]
MGLHPQRNKIFDWTILRALLLSSMPTALAGGLIALGERIYKTLTGVVLLAGVAMISRRGHAVDRNRETLLWGAVSVGAIVGLISKLTRWSVPGPDAHRTELGVTEADRRTVGPFYPGERHRRGWSEFLALAIFVFVFQALRNRHTLGGTVAGMTIGPEMVGQTAARLILSAILVAAGIQLVLV